MWVTRKPLNNLWKCKSEVDGGVLAMAMEATFWWFLELAVHLCCQALRVVSLACCQAHEKVEWRKLSPLDSAAFPASASALSLPWIPLWPGTQRSCTVEEVEEERKESMVCRKRIEADWAGWWCVRKIEFKALVLSK